MLEPTDLIILFALTFAASFVAALTGGAGLFTIPLMILLGVPAPIALSTNKVGSLGMMSGALVRLRRGDYLDWSLSIKLALLAGIFSYFGAHLLGWFDHDFLRTAAGVMVLLILLASLWFRSLGIEDIETSNRRKLLAYPICSACFFIGGFFGAGIGVITAFTMMYFRGQNIISARGNTMLPHLAMSATSLVVLDKAGFVDWELGALLAVAMTFGSYSGTSFGIKKGPSWVKKLFEAIIAVMALALLLGV